MLQRSEDTYKKYLSVLIMQHQAFTETLAACLARHYGGKIPSFATIARDFALHSPPGLPPISVETPRKWMRGQSLPSLERLQTLAHWLGPEILESLSGDFLYTLNSKSNDGSGSDAAITDVSNLLEQLSAEELASIKELLQHLVNGRTKRGNGKA